MDTKTQHPPIAGHIRKHFKGMQCIACSTTKKVIVDYKNGILNNPRVLDINTQTIDDFQPLCTYHYHIKQQYMRQMLITKIRPPCPDMFFVSHGIYYIEGTEVFDETDVNWGIGSYWYDLDAFRKKALEIMLQNMAKKQNISIKC